MKEKVWMVAFVLILGSVWTTALIGVDKLTFPIIQEHEREKLRISVLDALSIPYEGGDTEQVFNAKVESVEKDTKKIYRSKKGDIAFRISGNGVQGPISGVVAMQPDLKTIRGITIVHQEETPGLGDRVFEKETLDRFKGKKVDPQLLILSPGKAKKENEVDGVTGATLTGKAFEKILNSQIREYISLIAEDNQ
jgi:Na+-transporting NADH:ubiquinone oxidoreductase subunit C